MSATPKRKLCWNCDGSVPLAVDQCTYCGASLREGAAPISKKKDELSSPYGLQSAIELPSPPEVDEIDEVEKLEDRPEIQEVYPLVGLLSGSVFFLFGLVLKVFSEDGVFTLSWSSRYWYLYFFGGLFLLLYGYKTLQSIEKNVET